MKHTINTYLNLTVKVAMAIAILSTLFLFSNLTSEFYEIPKFLILSILTLTLLICLTVRFIVSGKVLFVRTPLDIPLLILLSVGIVSTILSPSPYVSLLGNQLRVHGSLISLVVYILFYFLLTNSLKSSGVKFVMNLALGAGVVLSAISLLSYVGVKLLPAPWVHGVNFTTTGSSFSTTAILTMLLPLVIMRIFASHKLPFLIINSVFLTIFGLTIALTGTWATTLGAVLAVALTLIVKKSDLREFVRLENINTAVALGAPLVIVALVTLLSFIPPVGGVQNPFYNQAKNFPREVTLPFVTSWKVSVSAFRDNPFWGSGPGTYLFDFTNYKPIEFNQSSVWNLRFDSAFNEYLGVLATLGGIGLLALLSVTALFFSSAWPHLRGEANDVTSRTHLGGELKAALAVSGLTFFVILALHASTLPVWVFGILILASFLVTNLSEGREHTGHLGSGVKQILARIAANVTSSESFNETVRFDTLPQILLVVSVGLTLASFFFGGKIILADIHHRNALNAVSQNNGILTYNELIAAEKLNPQNDVYRTDLAQTNFALANAIALAKAPTEASPTGSLTDQDKQNIQVLLNQSINEGRTAVALSPRSAINWEILGSLYRQISGVAQNALVFALDSYGKAIFQDPLNPLLRLNVGGIYYSIKNYDLAIRFFTDSVNLKPDFANGYYNLSVALKDKGDLQSAQAAADKMMELVDKNSPDYKVASDFASELKAKIASGSAQTSPITPPAASQNGALQQKELPKVVNVGNPPEKIASPGAVKKPNSTPEPTPSP